ncbi:MAG: hypothetical protein KIT79_03180 [Deltaproteobacteria bacterium]|nr:hypothetical protein [Deltaproteobacteria bacterium]
MMNLQQQFETAVPQEPDALTGDYAVHLVARFLPRPIRFLGHTKVFERTPDGIRGYNAFLGKLIKAGHFRVEKGMSADGTEVTKIIYDTRKNPPIMRPLVDEVRETRPGQFLGRGMYRLGSAARNIFWFTVTREN